MNEETEKLYARIASQALEINNLKTGYLTLRGELNTAFQSLRAHHTEETERIKRATIAAAIAATKVEDAASKASGLVLQAAQEDRSVSRPETAVAVAVAVAEVAATARAEVAEVVKAENERAALAIAKLAILETQHHSAKALLDSAIELAVSIASDTNRLKSSLEYLAPLSR